MFVSDRYNILTLQKLLGGFKDVSLKIINEKNKLELDDRKQEVIDTDFYNWLSHDLPLRSFLGVLLRDYHSLSDEDRIDFLVENIENKTYNHILITEHFSFYNKHKEKLGLNGYYERKSTMKDLFKTKWWETTQKNNLTWKKIHMAIRCNLKVKIYKREFRYFHSQEQVESLYTDVPELFREPTMKEKYEVFNYVYDWKPFPTIMFVDCNLEVLL